MEPVLIVGGGLTGLVAAEQLETGGTPAVVLEREAEPGGACRSLGADGYVFDYTGHLLHVARAETEAYLAELGVWDQLEVHERRAAVVIGGRTTPYPVQINTHGLAAGGAAGLSARFRAGMGGGTGARSPPISGRGCSTDLARVWPALFLPLQLQALSRRARGAEPRLGGPLRAEAEARGGRGWGPRFCTTSAVGYNATFRYPRSGGSACCPTRSPDARDNLQLEREVVRIHLGEGWVELADGERLEWRRLLSTISLPALMDCVVDELPEEVAGARSALRWVRVLNLALGVEGAAPSDEHWLYFPDPELPFYRVGFPSNHGELAPDGSPHGVGGAQPRPRRRATSKSWPVPPKRPWSTIDLLDPAAVRVRRVTVLDPAYVVFDHQRREAVALLRAFLRRHGVMLAGRWAEWKYSAMEDAILDGMTAARRLAAPE